MNDAATTLREQTIDPQVAGARVARMYARHGRTLYGLCRMLLRDADEAEDALQSTFLSAHRAVARGGVPRDEAAWLVTIARNECRGRIRDRMNAPVAGDVEELEAVADPRPTPDERLADPAVHRALGSLPVRQREAVVLHDALGLRSREVATALGMSTPAVEALLFRARRQLRLRLSPAGTLVLPATVGAALAQAIPGFVAPAAAGVAGATSSVAGAGILAKLAGAPTTAKVVAGVAAAATASSVAVVDATRERVTARPAPVTEAGDPTGSTPEQAVHPGGGTSTAAAAAAGAARPAPQAAGTNGDAARRAESRAGHDDSPAGSRERLAAPSPGDGGQAADDGSEHGGGSRDAPAAGSDDEAENQSAESDDHPARSGSGVQDETSDDGGAAESDGSRVRSGDEERHSGRDADASEDGISSGSGSEGSDVELDHPDEPDAVELDADEPEEPDEPVDDD